MNEHELFESALAAHSGREYFPRSQHHDGYARPADQNMWLGWQLARQNAWQPIDTAPKDEHILARRRPDTLPMVVHWWEGGWFHSSTDEENPQVVGLTEWRRL